LGHYRIQGASDVIMRLPVLTTQQIGRVQKFYKSQSCTELSNPC